MIEVNNVIIIGVGAAAHTAAIYAARATLEPLVIEQGEQATYSDTQSPEGGRPGFPQEVGESQLIDTMRHQGQKFGVRYVQAETLELDTTKQPFTVKIGEKTTYQTHTLILAEGCLSALKGHGLTKLGAKGSKKPQAPPGIFLCPSALQHDEPVPAVIAAGEGCQASIDAERWLQQRAITDADQHSERW